MIKENCSQTNRVNNKIGIITMFYNSSNYGGILQSFALVKHLENCGLLAEQIRYNNYSSFPMVRRIKNWIMKKLKCFKNLKYFSIQKNIRKRHKIVVKASERMIPHSSTVYSERTIKSCANKYNTFITGSDQVWHGDWPAYFLGFVPTGTKKIAYAASTGKANLSLNDINIIKSYVSDYTAISVRESDTAEVLNKEITDKSIILTLDPTLLLEKKEWERITSTKKFQDPYVFCYFLGSDAQIRELATQYAKKHNKQIVSIPHMQGLFEKNDVAFGDYQAFDATPSDFLSYIKYADTIITDSFHATVFSLIFQKQFLVFGRSHRKEMNNRLETLTELFNCKQRFVSNAGLYKIEDLEAINKIDYLQSFEKYENAKRISIDFLNNSLQ